MSIELLVPTMEVGVVTTNLEPMVEFYENYLGLALQTELRFPTGVQRRYAIGKNVLKLVTYDQPPPSGVVPGGGYTQEGFRYISCSSKTSPTSQSGSRSRPTRSSRSSPNSLLSPVGGGCS